MGLKHAASQPLLFLFFLEMSISIYAYRACLHLPRAFENLFRWTLSLASLSTPSNSFHVCLVCDETV